MAESSGDRQDEFSITGETTLNISKIIQGFLHGTGDLMGMAIQQQSQGNPVITLNMTPF